MSQALNPLTLPLQGSQLIEASAGTGKTWTIAALYVRLVLGHGAAGQGLGRPLIPGEILVMTFTKAATRELSDRIRSRLVESAAWFRGEATGAPGTFLATLLEAYPQGPLRQEAAWRLAMAAEAMDDAAVYTIDAWCQRMLREHAFDSGCLFDEELQASEAALLAEAVRDYWRQQVYPLDSAGLELALSQWKDLPALLKDMKALVGKPLPADAALGTLADSRGRGDRLRAEALAALKCGWSARADEMLAWLQAIWGQPDHPARAGLPTQANGTRWIQALKGWANDPTALMPEVKTGAERLTHKAVLQAFPVGLAANIPSCFAAFEALMQELKSLPNPGTALRLHAAAHVAERMQQVKRQAGTFGFADMLNRLDAALDESVQGAKAQRLRQRILDQYPVALIDEFQDTSPVQLRIFDRLYRIDDNDASRALLLIGDPKQAIYGFRGADIYSYLGARESTRGRHHVLGTNHRSTKSLVAAMNFLFKAAEDRPGEGAFLFRKETAAGSESDLSFFEVDAKGRAERFVTTGGEVRAVTLVVDPDLRNAADSREVFSALCAERIVTLLNDPKAGFAKEGRPFRRLQPADMAVLVRSGIEAEAVRRALRRRGLASVYLSDKDTVFETEEAADLLRLLRAVAMPRDARLARAALATSLLGLTLEELVVLASSDERFDRHCETLQQLNLAWKHQGVLAMIRRALHAFDLPARLLAPSASVSGGAGERRLTNVLHMAELLQAASAQVDGDQALLRWLAQQIEDGDAGVAGGDELVLRLESDADLVKVITVHKSKGLEYPLVFLPFPASFREVGDDKNAVLLLPGFGGRPELVLSPTTAQVAVAEKERQREYLRLLYVALTRARHTLWVGVAGLQVGRSKDYTWHRSALGYLLSGPIAQSPAQRIQDVEALRKGCPHVSVEMVPVTEGLPLPDVTPAEPREDLHALTSPPAYNAQFDRNWAISSYSALVRDAAWGAAGSGQVPARVVREDEPPEAQTAPAVQRLPAHQPWHRFPRGAFAGNFLHDMLEWLAPERFALDGSSALQQSLVRRCERQGWGHRSDDVVAWLRQVCTTPMPVLGVPLAGLASTTPELEFWFPSDGMQAGQVDLLCREHLLPDRPRPELPERSLKGMLMGFADLVFEHDGRYWVLDYKSNALGSQDADYTDQAMELSMLEHRYDVQAALYMLALHRLLKARLGPTYRPAQHLGGAIYLFLRGVHSPGAGCFHVAPSLGLLKALDEMLLQDTQTTQWEAA